MEITYHLENLSLNKDLIVSIVRREQTKISEDKIFNSFWATTIEPDINIDLKEKLSKDGAELDGRFIYFIENILQPALVALWRET
ncbi:MAG: hypothetical protein WBA13_07430 [Microcoleaceae cyanobacterium]